jgi:WD40 repeat protein/class 3 adenylate cyclase
MSARSPAGILTFLIADVRGYTSFTQQHGDEAAARLAAAFAELAREGVEAHGGNVIELRGDEALAVFESPREALRAAVELQLTFADEAAVDPTLPLRVGMGLDAGEAVPVDGGYRGGALNLAARLCSQARAGEVWVSQGVAHLARAVPELRLHEHGEIEAKGLAEPVRVFRAAPLDTDPDALAARFEAMDGARPARRSELPAMLDPVTPIIGRDTEVRHLRWLWRRARRGETGAAIVAGPAGIGKTRLAAAVAASAAESGAQIAYASYAEPHEETLPAVEDTPSLLVLDDLDAASPDELEAALGALTERKRLPLLVVAAYDDERASADLMGGIRKLPDGVELIRPRPLDEDAVRRIAALYLGPDVEVPREVLDASEGVPRRVHEQLAEWAHREASRRLGAFASRTATRRSDLRSVEADLAGSVVDLQLVREQARLFASRGAEVEEAPYKGLATFEVEDAEWFFGRERLVADLVARLAGATLLGVVGPSGSGKSSAVRAGLVPALRAGVLPGSDRWCTLIMRPGDHPLRELDRTLWAGLPEGVRAKLQGSDTPLRDLPGVLAGEERLVLVVDQAEEAFTACRDEAERDGFLGALADAGSDERGSVIVVLALRADFYGRFAELPELAELLGANHVLVGAPTPDEYRRAIEQPALRAGARVEPALVDELVAEVVGEPGALPLLSTALLEVWERREGRTISRHAALETGGVRGAVGRLAEDAYGNFTEEQQEITRAVLLRLAAVDEADEAVRRRVPLSEFDVERNPEVAHVVEVLTARRLLTVSDGTVEVAHEALLREWPRFRQWIDEDRTGRRLHAHLATTAREWEARGQDTAELYRGARLSAALDWTTEHTLELNELEREFVNASRVENERELVEQRRRNRRLRGLLAGVGVLLALAIAAGTVALAQRASAKKQARVALARELGSRAVSEPRIDRAMLLAKEAVNVDDSRQTEGTLLATLLRSPAAIGTFSSPITDRPQRMTLSPDGRTLAVVENTSFTRFYDTRTRGPSHAPLRNTVHIPPFYSEDGKLVVLMRQPSLTQPPALDLRDGHTLRHLRFLPLANRWLTTRTSAWNPLFLSPDGRTAYMAYSTVNPDEQTDGPAYVDRWDIRTGKLLGSTALGSDGMFGGRIDGGVLGLLTDTELVTVDANTLRPLRRTHVHLPGTSFTDAAAVAPNGRTIAAASPTGSVTFVDVASGHATVGAGKTGSPVQAIEFSPAGNVVVTTNENGQVTVWNPKTADVVETFTGHEDRTLGVAFSADGKTLYTCSLDGAIFEWDLGGERRFGRPFDVTPGSATASIYGLETGAVPNVPLMPPLAISPDGSRFAARIEPNTVGIFSMKTLRRVRSFTVDLGAPIDTITWSPAGDQFAVSGGKGRVQLWSAGAQPRLLRTLHGLRAATKLGETINAVEFSPGGDLVAAVAAVQAPPGPNPPVGLAAVWTTGSGKLLWKRVHRKGPADAVAFSRDGGRLALGFEVGPDAGEDQLVGPTTGRVERTLHPLGASQSLAFSPDGTLATGAYSGIVELWDPSSGRRLGHPVLALPAPVANISFTPSGDEFATGGGSAGFAKLWDTQTLQQLGAALPGSPGQWGNALFTPDGSKLVTLYQDGRGALWPGTLSAWEEHACRVAGRNFTHEEWSRFVTGRAYAKTCPD